MSQSSRLLTFVVLMFSVGLGLVRSASAQSNPITVTDQRQTQAVIRSIEKIAAATDLGLNRLQTGVDVLLRRLDENGAPDMRLTDIAAFYTRSVNATRFRQEARINAQANRQLLRLRAKANADVVIASLEEARDVAIAQVIAAETEALAAIAASLAAVVTP